MQVQSNDLLFKDANYHRAFFTQMEQPSESVVWNETSWNEGEKPNEKRWKEISWSIGKQVWKHTSWTIGGKQLHITDAKMNAVKAFFSSLFHKIRMSCSKTYRVSFRKTNAKFRAAYAAFCKRENKKCLEREELMVAYAKVSQQFKAASEEITARDKEAGELNKRWKDADELLKSKPPKLPEDDPAFLKLSERIEELENLKPFIKDYVKSRVPKEGIEMIKNWIGEQLLGDNSPEAVKQRQFADETLRNVKLNKEKPLDTEPFERFVSEEINKLLDEQENLKKKLDLPQSELKEMEAQVKLKQDELNECKNKRVELAKIMVNIREKCKKLDPKSDAPQLPPRFAEIDEVYRSILPLPEEAPKSEPVVLAPKLASLLQPITKNFLAALEQGTSKEMRDLWEGLLENFARRKGGDIVADYVKEGNTLKLQLKERKIIYMQSINKDGVEDPKEEPEGGSVLTLGDVRGCMTFTPLPGNELTITGFYVTARLPKPIADGLPSWIPISKYVNADLPMLKIQGEEVTITASKEFNLLIKKHSETRKKTHRVDHYINHWKNHGRVFERKAAHGTKGTPEEICLEQIRKKLILEKKIPG